MSSSPSADRNLLFGVIALQLEFINNDALIEAMNAWAKDNSKPIGDILLARQKLSAAQLRGLNRLVELHLAGHGNDTRRSIASVSTPESLTSLLDGITDPALQNSLQTMTVTADATPDTEEQPAKAERATNGSPCRYRVVRSHARGGLGEIFIAEDTELHREVALKEIQAQRAHERSSRARFILEAEITGGLEHPGIVPVYGFGIYRDGRPYYAMRFIRGESLKDAIDRFHLDEKPSQPGERSLAFRQLLRRFNDVCNAMAYAHTRGVVHRDLKPSNVMLGSFGETLIVDWGLAKAGVGTPFSAAHADDETLDPPLRPVAVEDVMPTQAGSARGTPQFMSPEQAAGKTDEVGPACDIYSLGVSLYMLLTGRKPFDGTDTSDLLTRVRRGDFPAPKKVQSETPAALDAICRKAMALNPADRYSTALELAADVEHWLGDEPVAAYPEPLPARLARWLRRHRAAVLAATGILISLVIALAVSTALVWREQRKTKQHQDIAEKNLQEAWNLSSETLNLMESAEAEYAAVPGLQSTRKQILLMASKSFAQQLARAPDNPDLKRRAGYAYRLTANVHRLANEASVADDYYRDSIHLYRDIGERENLSGTLRDYASMQAKVGRLGQAAETAREARAIAEAVRMEEPARPGPRRLLARNLLALASIDYRRGLLAEAGAEAGEASALFRGFATMPPAQRDRHDPLLLAAALNARAMAERDVGRTDSALPLHAEAVALLEKMAKDRPPGVNSADIGHFLANCYLEQSRSLAKNADERAKAEKILGVAIGRWEELTKKYPSILMYAESLGEAYRIRGELHLEGKQADLAGADLEKSRNLLEELVRGPGDTPSAQGELGRTYFALARLARGEGKPDEAARWLRKAAETLEFAVKQAPDGAENQRSLKEVRAERS
jgi:serine/threonine-protein kinase